MKYFKSLLLLMFCHICYGQPDTCLTEHLDSATFFSQPWIGNNQMLLLELDSIESLMRVGLENARMDGDIKGGANPNMYQIPVAVKNFYDAGNPKIPEAEIERYLNYVNKLYQKNGLYIRLYLRNILDINDANKNDVGGSLEANQVMGHLYSDHALNIAFVRKFDGSSGMAHNPQLPLVKKYTCVVRSQHPRIYWDNANTLAHEVGHCLGLSHTHDKGNFKKSRCNQEPVSRTQKAPFTCLNIFHIGKPLCEYRGDGLCDTDGDPDLGAGDLYNYYDCDYYDYTTLSHPYVKYDAWGSPWLQAPKDNALRNLMSYNKNKDVCRRELTPMQKAIMYKGARNRGPALNNSNPYYFYTNADVDLFENDNYWKSDNANGDKFYHSYFDETFEGNFNGNNKIDINSQQYHTFHLLPNSDGSYYAGDIDWVYFHNNGSAKDFIIQTLEVSGKPKPDTKITLYNVNASNGALGSQIAVDDNPSSNFSKLTQNLAPGYYAVKIENNITNVSQSGSKGHYYIRVDECYDKSNIKITGPDFICTSSVPYTINNLPSGSSISWSVSPSGLVSALGFNSTCNLSYLGSGHGNVTLNANVTTSCGVATFSKTILVGTQPPSSITPVAVGSRLKPSTVYIFTPIPNTAPSNITEYQWEVVSGGIVYNNTFSNLYGQIRTEALGVGQSEKNITVRFRWKGCNWSDWVYYYGKIVKNGGMDPLAPNFLVHPNPASGEISIAQQPLEEMSSKINQAARTSFQESEEEEEISTKNIEWIKVTDIIGNIKTYQIVNRSAADLQSVKIDVSGWMPGHYIAYIFDGETIHPVSFIVNH